MSEQDETPASLRAEADTIQREAGIRRAAGFESMADVADGIAAELRARADELERAKPTQKKVCRFCGCPVLYFVATAGKPTAGPWFSAADKDGIYVCGGEIALICRIAQSPSLSLNERMAYADFIAEAGTVYHETGLTPRQLAEERNKLQGQLDALFSARREDLVTAIKAKDQSMLIGAMEERDNLKARLGGAAGALSDARREVTRLKVELEHADALHIAGEEAYRKECAAQLAALTKERDEALAALRSVTGKEADWLAHDMDHRNRDHSKWWKAVEKAREFIERAGGKQ